MENRRAHLEMIQAVVNRLSQNSFLLKGWSVVLISSLFALAAAQAHPLFAWLAFFPLLAFWGLDAYFLRQERLFRKLYDRVRGLDENQIDFSMDTTIVAAGVTPLSSVAFSRTLLAFHGTLFCTVALAALIVRYCTP